MADTVAQQPQMTDYGVGGEDWSPLPWDWARRRLVPARNYWVVTVSGAGAPHAMPVWGVWDGAESRFAFSCAPGSRKAADLRANPRVVVAPEDTVECVSVQGHAEVVSDEARQQQWIVRYLAKYRPLSEQLSAEFIRANVLVEVVPDVAFGVIEREDEFAQRATRWRW